MSEDNFHNKAFEYTYNHFDDFLIKFPDVISKYIDDREELHKIHLEEQQKDCDNKIKIKEHELQLSLTKEKEILKLSIEEQHKDDFLNRELSIQKNYDNKIIQQEIHFNNIIQTQKDEQHKIVEELNKANLLKNGTHSMYKGETFE